MPEADDLDQRPPSALFVGEGKVGDHNGVAEEDYLVFAGELPGAALIAKLGVKLGGKVSLQPAIEFAAAVEMAGERKSVVEIIAERLPHLGRMDAGVHLPMP